MSQKALADALGVHWTTLSRQIHGHNRMPLATRQQLEALLLARERGGEGGSAALAGADAEAVDKERIYDDLRALGAAFRALPRTGTMSEEELLGFDDRTDGLK